MRTYLGRMLIVLVFLMLERPFAVRFELIALYDICPRSAVASSLDTPYDARVSMSKSCRIHGAVTLDGICRAICKTLALLLPLLAAELELCLGLDCAGTLVHCSR
jgi:hypothetical protein